MRIIIFLIIFYVNNLFGFLNDISIGTKQKSMGVTGVADSEDIFSAWWNPASISLNKKIEAGAFFNFNDTIPDYLLTALALKFNKPFYGGVLIVNESISEVVNQNRYILTLGKNILSQLSLGINIKILHLLPSGYQEQQNDPALKNIVRFQYDLGFLFKIFSKLNLGFTMRDLIRNYNLNMVNTKYIAGINGNFKFISFNIDLYFTDRYWNLYFGIQKEITKNIIIRAGLNELNPSWGCEIKFFNLGFAKLFGFQYSNSQLLGTNHSFSLKMEF